MRSGAEVTRRPGPSLRDEKQDDATLPDGMTCGDCDWFPRCEFLFGAEAESRTCDWTPIRFLAATPPTTPKGAR
jgi:hypothetical protein